MKVNTIRFKISILYTVLLGFILIVYSVILYVSLFYNLFHACDRDLQSKTDKIIEVTQNYVRELGDSDTSYLLAFKRIIGLKTGHQHLEALASKEVEWLRSLLRLGLSQDYINFFNFRGEYLVSSPYGQAGLYPLFLTKVDELERQHKRIHFATVKHEDRYFRLITRVFFYTPERQYIVQVATSLTAVIELMWTRFFYRLIPLPIILLIGFFIGRLFTARILRPVKQITDTAQTISYEDLGSRVETEHVDEEMQSLVDAFNGMIVRLEKSFRDITELSSNAAHELKTPLAIIRGEAEIALKKKHSAAEYERVITIMLDEAKRMLRVIEDLLLLTRLEYRTDIFHFEVIDLRPLLQEGYEHARTMATSKDITVEFKAPAEPVCINGMALHLRRLFMNLIDNAIKYTFEYGTITLGIERSAHKAIVTIDDTGVGIEDEHLYKIFDKFYRVATTSRAAEVGSGLGLSIVKTIADLHSATIEVTSTLGKGSCFRVIFPSV